MPFSPSRLNRREALRLLTSTTLTMFGSQWLSAAPPSPSSFSVLTPELTEGPYYIDLERMRRDITEGKPGVPLRLRIRVIHLDTGAPMKGAAVDVWHCDAQGVYSGFNGHMMPPGGGARPPGPPPSDSMDDPDDLFPPGGPPGGTGFGPGHVHQPDNKETFLRGVQLTNDQGISEIVTIFPGWYTGRTTHIHVRVHVGGLVADGRYRGGHISHTGQIFFPDPFTDAVYQLPAYTKKEDGRVSLKDDGIYLQGGQSLAQLTPLDPAHLSAGLVCNGFLIIDPAATPQRT